MNWNFLKIESIPRTHAATTALTKIETIPPVTELRKALINDFRRVDVRKDWHAVNNDSTLPDTYQIATFRCVASSGTYMRSLSEVIAQKVGTVGLAWHIHRTEIGQFSATKKTWLQRYN